MAALDFPGPPLTNGQVFTGGNGVQYVWNGTIWLASSMASQASDTPPANPQTNQLWFNSSLGQLFIYYTDANSSQWVPANPTPSGVPVGGGIVREVTLASPAATIDLFSLGVKSVQMMFVLIPVSNSGITFRRATGSTVNTTSVYTEVVQYQPGATASSFSGYTATTTKHSISGGVLAGNQTAGYITYPDIGRNNGIGEYANNEASVTYSRGAHFGPPGHDGFQFICDTGNFAAGSFVRVIGWP